MNYEHEEAPGNFGWLSIVLSAATMAYNYITGEQKADEARFQALAAQGVAEREAAAQAAAEAEKSTQAQKIKESVTKSLPVIGVILAASLLGGIVGKRKKK